MRPASIKFQISLLVSLVTLGVVFILSAVAYVEFKESLLGNIDATLKSMAEGMRVAFNRTQSHSQLAEEFDAISGQDDPSHITAFRIWTDGAAEPLFVGAPDGLQDLDVLLHPARSKAPDPGQTRLFNRVSPDHTLMKHYYRAAWMRYPLRQEMMNILVLHSSDYVYHEVGEFLRGLLIIDLSVTVAVLLLVRVIVPWGLRSITRAGAELEQVDPTNLASESVIRGEVPSELRPFKSALDGMLARLNRAMRQQSQLTADVAHELRTPLAVIQSSLEALRMQPRSTLEYEEGIDDALQDVERLKQLIAQILSLARLEAADDIPQAKDVDLDTLLQSLVEVFDDQAVRQGGRVLYENSASASVRGNEAELQQLFSNLLDNAVRYGTSPGTVRVSLQNGSAWVSISIHNGGNAIPPESLPHVFDRFYRVDTSRSQASGGSGLGLAIVREIILRHHGDIQISSDAQTGTSVLVRLPS